MVQAQGADGGRRLITRARAARASIAGVLGGKTVSYREVADVLAPIKGIEFRNLTENFAAVVGGRPQDFMDDGSIPVANFAHLARSQVIFINPPSRTFIRH